MNFQIYFISSFSDISFFGNTETAVFTLDKVDVAAAKEDSETLGISNEEVMKVAQFIEVILMHNDEKKYVDII